MTKKRTPPSALVAGAGTRGTWFSRLATNDRNYVRQVVVIMRDNPSTSVNWIATALIRELNLTYSRHTIAETLKEMINVQA